ncbi:MAG: zinc-ribbon domain containing protein [Patescibacteria group bacterium]|jgi:CxxC-x17-CxxC domain-containing protein
MSYEDKTLVCKECGKEFTWTAGEQEFYAQKGFTNQPSRCKDCRQANKQHKDEQRTEITCKQCGKKDTVNFKPHNPDDILCNECFTKNRAQVHSFAPASDSKPAEEPVADEKSDEETPAAE